MTGATGKARVRASVVAAPVVTAAPDAEITARMVERFEMLESGLFRRGDDDGQKGKLWICGAFKVEAETRNDTGGDWGFLLSWLDRDGFPHTEVFSRGLFNGECTELRNRMADGGLTLNPRPGARLAFGEYMSLVRAPERARVVSRVGWHEIAGRLVYALPDETFGDKGERVLLTMPDSERAMFGTAGTLSEWRTHIGRRCCGNSRLMFAASCGFAAPLLHLLGEDGGGFNFIGSSSLGKSTALDVAASVCGGTPGVGARAYVKPWRATANGLESVAVLHSDGLLPLDEMGQADPREIGETAYMLANGSGKIRAGRTGQARAAVRFRTLFLSSGELGLARMNAEAGRTTKAGQEVRLVDIPADAGRGLGLFEELHDAATADAFTRELKAATAQFYGTALRAYLAEIIRLMRTESVLFTEGMRSRIAALIDGWLVAAPDAGGQVRRVAGRFAMVGLAGDLATRANLTDWPECGASDAAGACFQAWLADRGTAGAREDSQAKVQLRNFVLGAASARFEDWHDPSAETQASDTSKPPIERFRTQNRAGWRRYAKLADGRSGWRYYLTGPGMNEAMQGLSFRDALKVLADAGMIVPSARTYDAGSGVLAQLLNVPGVGRVRLYQLSDDVLAGDSGEG